MKKYLKTVFFPLIILGTNTLFAKEVEGLINQNLAKADSLKLAYKYQDALAVLSSTLQQYDKKMNDTLKAAIYFQEAEVFYYKHQKEEALAKAEQALTIQRAIFSEKHKKTATTAYLIGLVYQRFHEPQEAQQAILKSIKYTPNSDANLYYRHRRLGYLYADVGKDDLAIKHFQKALVGFAKNSLAYIRISYWLATSLGKNQQIQQAKKYFTMAKATCKAERMRFPTERRYLTALHATLLREATLYTEINQPKKALQLYEQLIKIKDQLAITQKDLLWTFSVEKMELYFDYTKVFRAAGNTILDYKFVPATEEITDCDCQEGLASTYEKMALLYDRLENYNKSIMYLQKAIKQVIPEFQPTSLYELPVVKEQLIVNKHLLVRLLFTFSKIMQSRYDSKENLADLKIAVKSYPLVDSLTTIIRQQLTVAKVRYKVIGDTKDIFENAIQLNLRLFTLTQDQQYLENAYQFSTKNKAIILLDGLQNEQAKIAAGITDKQLLKEEKRLKKAYNNVEIELLNTENTNRKQELYEKRFKINIQYERLIKQLEEEYPAYYELKYAFTDPLSVRDIQRQLPDSTLLLEYFLGAEQLFVFTISQSDFQYNIISLRKGFRDSCTVYNALIESGTAMPKVRYNELAYQLYQTLLEQPLNPIKQAVNRLIIIPDDVLIPISFATLLTKPTPTWLGRENPYLLHNYATSYAYANQLLFDQVARERVDKALKEFGGFGIEYHQETAFTPKEVDRQPPVFNRTIGALPNSDEEVLRIYQFINGFSWIPLKIIRLIPFLRKSVWINEEATKENFVTNAADYKILHLAMHSLLANENPLNSSLVFSPRNNQSNNHLQAGELYTMNLNAEMVVLGACDTGRGKINKGEGIRSLARVFTYIGCPSLVASLWKASDRATRKIMLPFYKHLVKRQPKDLALQKAQLQYLNAEHPELAAPAFWGHLVIIGDTRPIEIRSKSNYWKYGIVIFLLSIVGITLKKAYNKNR